MYTSIERDIDKRESLPPTKSRFCRVSSFSSLPIYVVDMSLSLSHSHSLVSLNFKMKLLWVILIISLSVGGRGHHHRHHAKKLFVFGDSYADTGNLMRFLGSSWAFPYGITFPGKPTGRFSDGRVLTDFVAKLEGLHSPLTYKFRKLGPKSIGSGINFAYGGTGVFDTLIPFPNMTTQIDMFQQMIQEGKYSAKDIQKSMALVSVAGNDYTTYQANNGTLAGVQAFIRSLISQLSINLKRINDIGVKKIAVTGLPPLGCLPFMTIVNSYQQCNGTINMAAMYHNSLLNETVDEINKDNQNSSVIVLDLYESFISNLQNQGKMKFGSNPLKPCCAPTSAEYDCGSENGNGTKMYTLCEKPESAFFWDLVHPTQMAWSVVFSSLKKSIENHTP